MTLSASTNYLSLWLLLFGFLSEFIVPGYSAKDYAQPGLDVHNEYREDHNCEKLTLDDELSERADKCAQHYIDKGKIDHSCPDKGRVGENLYWRGGTDKDATTVVKQAVKLWYDEIKDYDFDKNDAKKGKNFGNIGHFTQVVWNGSKKLGVGYAAKDGVGVCVVSLYDPPGNYKGQYAENVPRASKGEHASSRSKGDCGNSASLTRNIPVGVLGIILFGGLLRCL